MAIDSLEEINIGEFGEITLEGKAIEEIFPIGKPERFSDQWDRKWQDEMTEEAPVNARYFTCKVEQEEKMVGYNDVIYEVATIQFYGLQKEKNRD